MKGLFLHLIGLFFLFACENKSANKNQTLENKPDTTQKQIPLKSDSVAISSDDEPKKTNETIEEEP
ncbi:MAG: hypothetical protein RMJ97_03995 [Raineya sp.]|nr:hypothetical protein [Raineya sp.]MDW8296025.1 hypothetical protein [Raineya sp.]